MFYWIKMLKLNVPAKINIEIFEDYILIQGPLGIKKKKKSKTLELVFDQNTRILWFLNATLKEKHFYFAIINKLILGVLKGFSVKLQIIGVGYKAFLENQQLILKLGFSHNVIYPIPKDVTIKILNQKIVTLVVLGNDFQKVNQIAAEIRFLKKAEPYKGKGIKYFDEIVKRKEGKKTNV